MMADTLLRWIWSISEYNLTTRECLARADLIGWDPKVSQNLTKQNAKLYSPSQVWPQIMCHTHSWPQQVGTQQVRAIRCANTGGKSQEVHLVGATVSANSCQMNFIASACMKCTPTSVFCTYLGPPSFYPFLHDSYGAKTVKNRPTGMFCLIILHSPNA